MADRYWERERDWDRGRRYHGEGYYGAPSDFDDREREHDRRIDEGGILDRLRDEVRSWFVDEREERRHGRDERDRGRWGGIDDSWRDWARQWGYVEGRGQRRPDYDWGYGVGTRARFDEYATPRRWDRGGRQRAGGSFAGLGPHGYRRSDERIREDVCERMCDSAELDASDIEIVVVGGEVTLTGSVHDRDEKRLAEDLSENVSGVREVHNQLRVSPGSREQDASTPNRPGEPPRYRVA